MSRIKNNINKLLQNRLAPLALACALGMAFGAQAQTLAEGITPAADAGLVPAAAKLRKDTVVAGILEPQGIFNPYLFTNGWDENVTDVIFSRLIGLDSQGKPVGRLAESWQVSPDNLTYTIKLRSNLVYSDGSPLKAEDIAFTLTLLHDPAYDGETDITPAHIQGGDAYKNGAADSVSGLKVIDDRTIQITTTQAGATTLQLIGGPVLSKAYYGKDYRRGKLDGVRALSGKPLGNGPYIYDKYVPGQEIRFHANPNFYLGAPPMARFIYRVTNPATNFQLFQTGETDYDAFTSKPDDIEQLKLLGFANINLYGSSDYSRIDFNLKRPALQDKRVRQALIYGLDRQKLISVVYQGYGTVANQPISPISWAYDATGINPYAYDLAKARRLLDEAGWKAGADGIRQKDGKKLELTLLVTKKLINDALVPIAKDNYRQLGVVLKPQVLDFNALLAQRKTGNYDLASLSTSTLNDPHDGVRDFISRESATGYSNPQVDALIAKANATLDIEQRKPLYHQLYQLLAEDPPVILLGNRKILSASSARVTGFKPDIYNGLVGSLPDVRLAQ
ncbi:Oligopeptide-binding protein AppA precursor [Serratia entomophila]|uniref:ABC transporter substrate-binding protein n=2 Tax=Serratia entomophila TaxID=42906 RepID=A0ABY5CNI1_9GAMM|nr:ABC transporter substrate-binding protein [Serratia entomophila]USU99135.1 ABC transporter substrate-binding protein [Serratia entomophila]CAI0710242.1 Oligopeptide-binding protein AppA precursor [Serratia entomophila]CAI0743147.1 Oligopeptide-binding protein AppA precursor [Serratia entomophila]CAI0743815.1 Oligopeptide-binding protein AppA precursor [Serratia entomophila]CAI0746426.1 Oligopeptide-binding protein AppA precursor [Serratia entomophila]